MKTHEDMTILEKFESAVSVSYMEKETHLTRIFSHDEVRAIIKVLREYKV